MLTHALMGGDIFYIIYISLLKRCHCYSDSDYENNVSSEFILCVLFFVTMLNYNVNNNKSPPTLTSIYSTSFDTNTNHVAEQVSDGSVHQNGGCCLVQWTRNGSCRNT